MPEQTVIEVLFADDNDSKVEGVTKLIHFEPDIRIVANASTMAEALAKYQELDPDVVLMDPGLPETDGFAATRSLLELDPLAQVVFVAMDAGNENVRKAMKVGACDYIDNYIQGDRLAVAIREAAAKGARVRKATGQLPPLEVVVPSDSQTVGKTVALFSPKGGAGVTTLAVNLALALHSNDTPAAIVDADLQFGDVCTLLNLQTRYSIVDLVARVDELDDDLLSEMLAHYEGGLHVVPGPQAPELADDISGADVKALLTALRRRYSYVVVDTASYLNDVSLAVLEEADLVLSVILPEIPSIKNAKLLLDLFYKLDLPRQKLIFVMNQMERKEQINAALVSDKLNHPVVAELPFDRPAVKGATNKGRPLFGQDRMGAWQQALLDLAGETKERLLAAEPAAQQA